MVKKQLLAYSLPIASLSIIFAKSLKKIFGHQITFILIFCPKELVLMFKIQSLADCLPTACRPLAKPPKANRLPISKVIKTKAV